MVEIVHRIGIRAPVSDVYKAVATAEGVSGWWARDTKISGAGENFIARFERDGREIGRMGVEMMSPNSDREVRWRFVGGPPEWIGTEATFDLAEADGMTILVFGHRRWTEPGEFMAHCSMKWAVFLMSLREMLETGVGRPAPEDIKIDNWN